MNPTVRPVNDPIAFGRKVNLIAFVRVPDRFAAPIHRFRFVQRGAIGRPFLVFALIPVPL
jgi:hypothetical protein